MRRLTSGVLGTALAASLAIASAMPLNAAPIHVPKSPEVSAEVETVHYRRYKKRHYRYYSRYDRCYYDPYYCRPRYHSYRPHYYSYRRHYRPYYPRAYWYDRRWDRGGVSLEFSF